MTADTCAWQERLQAHLQAKHPELALAPQDEAELLLILGGDGTLLETLRDARLAKAQLLALNTGHVGFLSTERDPGHFIETVEAGLARRLVTMEIPIMEISHHSSGQTFRHRAVNDALIERTMTWSTLRVERVDADRTTFLKDIRGSGLCACSAIGSTTPMATHFQAPIMDPLLRAFYLKGVNDTGAPKGGLLITAGGTQAVRITLRSVEPNLGLPESHRLNPVLYLDGAHRGVLGIGDRVELRYATAPGILLRTPDDLHWDRVRELP